MSAVVPHFRPTLADVIRSGVPVAGDTWQTLASLANWCMGHGGMLIPWTGIEYIVDDDQETFSFYVAPKAQAVERVWCMVATGFAEITFGSATAVSLASPGTPSLLVVREALASKSSTAGGVTVTVDSESAHTRVHAIACYEQTRAVLDQDTTDYGVDITTCAARQPIADFANESLAGVCDAYKNLDCRRAGYFSWSCGEGEPIMITAGSFTELFPLWPQIAAPVYSQDDLTLTLTVAAYAKVNAGTGQVRFTADTGDDVTLSITSTSYAWVTGTLTVAVEGQDPDSFPEDSVLIEGNNNTATTLSIAAISIVRPVTAGSPL